MLLPADQRPSSRLSRLTASTYHQRSAAYNDSLKLYNAGMSQPSHVMTVSRNGQVSIPAQTRARWNAGQVIVVDLGDRIVMRPLDPEPVRSLRGKYAGRGPSTSEARRQDRRDDDARAKVR